MGNHHSQNPTEAMLPRRRTASDSEMAVEFPQQHKQLLRRTSSTIGYHPRSASLRRMRSIQRRHIAEGTNTSNAKRTAKMEAENKKIQEKKHLLAACARGDISKVEMLVDNGVDVNSADKDQMTALHYASMHARDEIIQSLISRGAEVNTQDLKGGFTAMHWVVINAEPSQYGSINHQEKSLTTLFRAGAKVDAPDFNLATPLHTAAQKGNKGAVQALMRLGANPDALDITGRNCFEVAKCDQMRGLLKRLHEKYSPCPGDTPIYQVLEAPLPSFPVSLPPTLPAPPPPTFPALLPHRLSAPPPPSFPAPLPPSFSTPLPPVLPPPRLVTAAKANSVEHIYNTLELSPFSSERSRSVTPSPPPPRRRRQYAEDNHVYHILEVPSPNHRQPSPPRRRKVFTHNE